jgi:hypothetical protein
MQKWLFQGTSCKAFMSIVYEFTRGSPLRTFPDSVGLRRVWGRAKFLIHLLQYKGFRVGQSCRKRHSCIYGSADINKVNDLPFA